MPLDQIYLSRNELIARLVGYSSKATPIFTGLLRITLSGYSSSKYSLGLIRGAIVYAEGKRNGVTVYGGTALRSLLEELANPNVTGRVDFIELMRYEVETKISGNPLIALELPVYFGDLVTLIPGYQSTEIQAVAANIHKRDTARTIRKKLDITRKIRRRKKKIKVRFLSDPELVEKYSELISSYYEHLVRKTKPLGLLTAATITDLIELLSKYGKQKHIILAKVSTSDETINCIALIVYDRIAGIYCDNMGITITNRKAIEFLAKEKKGYTVELRRLILDELYRETEEKVLHSLTKLKGYYTGFLELNNDAKIKYYVTISNNRIIRIAGKLYLERTMKNINKTLAIHILPYILVSEKKLLTPVKREEIDSPWIKVDESSWKYATSMARLIIENLL